jgi:hypothetical protein
VTTSHHRQLEGHRKVDIESSGVHRARRACQCHDRPIASVAVYTRASE